MDPPLLHFLPHAQAQMRDRNVSVREVMETIMAPDSLRTGRFGRLIAERDFGTYVLRVVYNEGQDEYVIITAIPIRKRGGAR